MKVLHKVKYNGTDDNLLSLIDFFFVCITGIKELFLMVNLQNGKMLTLEYYKFWFCDHFFFLISINDLPQGPHSDFKFFVDDTSLFSVIHDFDASSAALNNYLVKTLEWALNWRKCFLNIIETNKL